MRVSVLERGSGKTVRLEVEPNHTVRSVAEIVVDGLNLSKGKEYVVVRGQNELQASDTLISAGVRDGDLLELRQAVAAVAKTIPVQGAETGISRRRYVKYAVAGLALIGVGTAVAYYVTTPTPTFIPTPTPTAPTPPATPTITTITPTPTPTPNQTPQLGVVFSDGFESYAANAFPSGGGWQLIQSGADIQDQIVVGPPNVAYSGTKSLRLIGGASGTAAYAARAYHSFNDLTSSTKFGYEVAVFVAKVGGNDYDVAVGLQPSNPDGCVHCTWGLVKFSQGHIIAYAPDDRMIDLGSFTQDNWYLIRVTIDTLSRTFDVWVNGQQVASNEPLGVTETPTLDSIFLESGYAMTFFDNVSVLRS